MDEGIDYSPVNFALEYPGTYDFPLESPEN